MFIEHTMSSGRTAESISRQNIPQLLPHGEIYTINIGDKTFQLSGESLSFDGPSFFTDYFCANRNTKSITINRSPKVFKKICMYLQGYAIQIGNEYDYVHLLVDAAYYRLQKLKRGLVMEPMMVSVGGETFKIYTETLNSPGNSPNYFTLIHSTLMGNPFMENNSSIQPLPIQPNTLNRSPQLFKELLYGLHGHSIHIKSDLHRRDLIEECEYYRFFGLKQRLIKHQIRTNPFTNTEEITINHTDIKVSGLLNDTMDSIIGLNNSFTVVKYSRPYVDEGIYRDLVIQLESSEVNLMINTSLKFCNLLVYGETCMQLKKILSKVSDDYVYEQVDGMSKLIVLIQTADSVGKLNGMTMDKGWINTLMDLNADCNENSSLSKKGLEPDKVIVAKLLKSQWTIHVQGRSKVWMNCLKIDGVLDLSHYNEERVFL